MVYTYGPFAACVKKYLWGYPKTYYLWSYYYYSSFL